MRWAWQSPSYGSEGVVVDITNEAAEAWERVLSAAGIEMDMIEKILREIAEAAIITYMELEKAMVQVANIARAGLVEAANELEEFEALRKEAVLFNPPTARDRKAAREKQRAIEQAATSRFRQYKASERAWSAQKRSGPRRREWRGPRKEN